MAKARDEMMGVEARKVILFVLFVPSADRDGKALSDQDDWKRRAMEIFGRLFGGATAMPPADGVWRDDGRDGRLIWEKPVLVHSYAIEEHAADNQRLVQLGGFCRQMLKATRQGEVGLIVDNVYHAFYR